MNDDALLLNEQAYFANNDHFLLKSDVLFAIDDPRSVNKDALPHKC